MKVVFFDGICIMCNGFVRFLHRNDQKGELFFCDLRSEKARELLAEAHSEIQFDTIVFLNGTQKEVKSAAMISIIASLGGMYKAAVVLRIIPAFIRDAMYQLVAKNRFLAGEQKSCALEKGLSNKIIG